MRKNIQSPNLRKNAKSSGNSKGSQQYRLYSNIPSSKLGPNPQKLMINQQTLEMMSPCQKSTTQLKDKQTLHRKRTERLLEYNEGIKEVENMAVRLRDAWSLFEFEKKILLMNITSFLKLKENSEFQKKLIEGLEYFFREISQPADLLEVPANQMVSELLKSESMDPNMPSQEVLDLDSDLTSSKNIFNSSAQLLLTAAKIKEILCQKLMIEKICENKGLEIRHLDSMLRLCSLQKKFRKQVGQILKKEETLKTVERQRDELRKMMSNFIEKSGVMTTGVDTLNRIMKSNNDMQKTLQQVISQGSPQKGPLLENQFGGDEEKAKLFLKEHKASRNSATCQRGTIFSPIKELATNGECESERNMMTPKTVTFAEKSSS